MMIIKMKSALLAPVAVALALSAFATGCTADNQAPTGTAPRETGTDADGAGGAAALDGRAGEAGRARGGLLLTWQVSGLQPLGRYVGGDHGDAGTSTDAAVPANSSASPLSGVKVCLFEDESSPCATTDAAGRFSVSGLPAKSQVMISFEKAGYVPMVLPIETGSTDMDGAVAGPLPMPSAEISPWSMPVAIDSVDKGMIVTFAVTLNGGNVGGAVGTNLTLTPKRGDGPYFITDRNLLDVSATSIVNQAALYVNLDPGTYELGFEKPGHDCASLTIPFGFGFTSGPGSVKCPVVAGFQSMCGVLCTPSSTIVNTGD